MSEEGNLSQLEDLEARMVAAFREAYPGIPEDKLVHMARNFTQVVNGIISIGELSGEDVDVTHMDVTNGLVYSCVMSTFLEDLQDGEWQAADGGVPGGRIGDEDMKRLQSEIVARVADWLLGLEVLRGGDPKEFRSFVKGAVALGAEEWERERGGLSY